MVTLWGFGFADSKHDPATVRAITAFFRNNTPGGAYIMAGTPAHWRTSVSDADPNPDFVNVWLEEFDAISPWTIGRYSSPEEADRFAEEKIKGDVELIRSRNERFEMGQGGKRKVDYIPVIFPGGSVSCHIGFCPVSMTQRCRFPRGSTYLRVNGGSTTSNGVVATSCGGSSSMYAV